MSFQIRRALLVRLSEEDRTKLKNSAKIAQAMERRWVKKMNEFFEDRAVAAGLHLEAFGSMDGFDFDILPLLLDHRFDVLHEAIARAMSETELKKKGRRMALPRTLRQLFELYEKWRKGKEIPRKYREAADKIKSSYIKKVQKTWVTKGKEFREGALYSRSKATQAIQEATKMPRARAITTVQTETSRFYNEGRRAVYDGMEEVTHYLFVAIRDFATTKWCRTRQGLVYEKGTLLLDENTPPCFLGFTPVLTLKGWKRIDCIGTADYVWTHENRWRKVEKVHCTPPKLVDLFQIGFGVATGNHPYFERGRGFVEARNFEPKKGVRSGFSFLCLVWRAALDALVQARPKILLDAMPHFETFGLSAWSESSVVERWEKDYQSWLCGDSVSRASASEQSGLCPRAHSSRREKIWQKNDTRRGCASLKPRQKGQSTREHSPNDKERALQISSKLHIGAHFEAVYNLEVEEDHTYYAGGYLVHNCHWNCRSELLPLTPYNPKHLKLIQDESIQAKNRHPEPLPHGWSRK